MRFLFALLFFSCSSVTVNAQVNWNVCEQFKLPVNQLAAFWENNDYSVVGVNSDSLVVENTNTSVVYTFLSDTISFVFIQTNDWELVKQFYEENKPAGIASNGKQNGKVCDCMNFSYVYFYRKNAVSAKYRYSFSVQFDRASVVRNKK